MTVAPLTVAVPQDLDKGSAAVLRLERNGGGPERALAAVADLTALAVDGILASHPEVRRADGRHDGAALRRLWKRYEP